MGTQRNVDESLFIILYGLFPESNSREEWDPTSASPLIEILAHLSCHHSDLYVRHMAFRIIGEILRRFPSPLEHMRALHGLLTDDSFPAMRVAAVGLLKDAVVGAFASSHSGRESPFSSPILVQTFGRLVLRVDPENLFEDSSSPVVDDPMLMMQYKRVAECISFYYVLLSLDSENKVRTRTALRSKALVLTQYSIRLAFEIRRR